MANSEQGQNDGGAAEIPIAIRKVFKVPEVDRREKKGHREKLRDPRKVWCAW